MKSNVCSPGNVARVIRMADLARFGRKTRAEFFGDYPEKQRHAENVENLAKYLRQGAKLTSQLVDY